MSISTLSTTPTPTHTHNLMKHYEFYKNIYKKMASWSEKEDKEPSRHKKQKAQKVIFQNKLFI